MICCVCLQHIELHKLKKNKLIVCLLCCVYRCIVGLKLTRSGTERLTGAGPRSQRGLESPGAEVGRCSLKDEGDRQGDKHGPLSTWGSSIFVFFLILLSLLVCSWSVVFFLWPFFVCFLPGSDDRAVREGCFQAVHYPLPLSLSLFWRFLACVGTSTLWIYISGFR